LCGPCWFSFLELPLFNPLFRRTILTESRPFASKIIRRRFHIRHSDLSGCPPAGRRLGAVLDVCRPARLILLLRIGLLWYNPGTGHVYES
jgi:hypothetical protein